MSPEDEELFKRLVSLAEIQGWQNAIAAEMCERIRLEWHVHVMKVILAFTLVLAIYGALK